MARYVITGGPGVGKTTLCNELRARGYTVIDEVARQIIAEENEKPRGVLPWNDLVGFQYLVLQKQETAESQTCGDAFLDRGILDGIAYCRIGGVQAPAKMLQAAKHPRYDLVFLLDRLQSYRKDAERREDAAYAAQLHEGIERVYREHGYTVVRVPDLGDASLRADFVLECLREKAA
jgi:predicted ATPase